MRIQGIDNVVKGLKKIELTDEQAQRLNYGAMLYRRYERLEFKILKYENGDLVVRAKQNKNASEKYLTAKEIIEKTRKLFQEALNGLNFASIVVHPVVYEPSLAEEVTPDYLKKQLQKKGLRIKDIQNDTGLETSNISAWVNGIRPMSHIVKNFFIYYFKAKELEQVK